ncbi:DUF4132 domain-containing protein [Kribbella sandramycini]|uniref:DUF4132 domain-containing protein n=1 Tax=Kribbella sandramycini TaxID=60450 RepID=A0A7Y4L583_9ACTN|nr:DUF4132 domain-containing protein [Kribbella sandramycini]MBB6566897.1 hypothetical protein [Kribbella sandramycini]NOL44619.1 DUF4132 domain-containing protein [Kribbella sandramycini]
MDLLRSVTDLIGKKGDSAVWQGIADHVLTGSPLNGLPPGGFETLARLGLAGQYSIARLPQSGPLTEFVGGLAEVPDDVLQRWIGVLGALLSTWPPSEEPLDPTYGLDAVLVQLNSLWPPFDDDVVRPAGLDHAWLEKVATLCVVEPAKPLIWAFGRALPTTVSTTVLELPGYEAAAVRHAAAITAEVDVAKPDAQRDAWYMLRSLTPESLTHFVPMLVPIVASTDAAIRRDAAPLLGVPGVLGELRRFIETAKPAVRSAALKALWATEDPEQRRWAHERATADRAASVRDLVSSWDAQLAAAAEPSTEAPPVDLRVPVTPELREKLRQLATEGEKVAGLPGRTGKYTFSDAELAPVFETLETGRMFELQPRGAELHPNWVADVLAPHVGAVGPVVATLLLARAGLLTRPTDGLSYAASRVYVRCYEETGRPEPLEIARIFDAVGFDGAAVLAYWDRGDYEGLRGLWSDEAIAPFARHALPHYLTMLTSPDVWYSDDDAIYHAIATLQGDLPLDAVDKLLRMGLGQQKTYRVLAQDAVAHVPGIADRIAAALTDGKATTRQVAAQWLQRINHVAAVPALETALRKEKNELAKAAFLDALQGLGEPIESYLDHEAMLGEANASVTKGLHKELAWLDWSALPVVHWAESGDAVPLPVLQWLTNQAVKAKSPEPGALLRTYAALIEPAERERFGRALLDAWIAEDTRLPEPDEVQDPDFADWPVGSAIGSKGVLAVVAACAGADVVPVAGGYLKYWYGTRSAQCKALVVMLGWIEQASATQLVLSVASRFRTKGIQEEAVQQAAALAERRGWSLDELADRTVPYAGFDETGRIELSYGDRAFTAEVAPDLTVALADETGQPLKALPAPRQSDDADAAAAAKKTLGAAKRELKALVQAQTTRLYEAMCTGRSWLAADWQLYLNGHPILRRLSQRLTWIADGARVFRPLDDGTLTTVDDDPIELAPDAVITLAHDTLLTSDAVQAWQEHFTDYELVPLFQQFGRGSYLLPPEKTTDKALHDFEGHLVEAFALRSRAGKLGYLRGETGDGGWFYSYEKRLPAIGLTVELGFTGNLLPEENKTVALTELAVRGRGHQALRLSDVPQVLLSEAYNDLRQLAADGSGFDPAWQQTTGR